MRFLIFSVFLFLTANTLQECRGQSIFRKLTTDIKHAAEKFVYDVKRHAEDIVHVGKDFGKDVKKHVADKFGDEFIDAATSSGDMLKNVGIDVEKVVKVFRHDVSVAWMKAKPYMKEVYIYIDGDMKTLENVDETHDETFELVDIVKEKLKNKK